MTCSRKKIYSNSLSVENHILGFVSFFLFSLPPVKVGEDFITNKSAMKILDIAWKGWIDLWRSLFYTVGAIIFGLMIILTRGTIKALIRAWRLLNKAIGVHPAGALAGFAVVLVLVSLSFVVRSGIERRETSLVVDSISHVCDSLRNGDRYEAGYADGVKAMRNRKLESGL